MSFDNLITNYDLYILYFMLCGFAFALTAYLFCKAQSIKLICKQWLYLIVFGIGSSLLYVLLKKYDSQLANLIMNLLIPLCISFIPRAKTHSNIVVAMILFCAYQIIKVFSTLLTAVLFWAIGSIKENLFVYFVNLVIATIICVVLAHIRRFQKGVQFFEQERNLGLGLAICGIVFILTSVELRNLYGIHMVFVVVIIGVIISGFGLYLWIQRSITAHYRERLQLKSEEHYKEILEERDKEIKKLNQSNEYLAKIVHRDNHLMSALNASIDTYFNSEDESRKEDMLHELQTLAKERGEQIDKEIVRSKFLPSTGNLLIDSAVNDLYIKAAAHGIDFNLTVSSTVDEIIGKYISQTDLQTLLSDHVKDAIIAVESRGEAGGKLLVNLSTLNDNYCIDIYDNGVDFDVDTLSKLGLERVTTHADTGGSGIGFMTTFETLRKAYASLIITEFENKTPFSKSVAFRFDGESAFIIHSYRSEILKASINRNDMIIVS